MVYQRLRFWLTDDRVVLLLQGLENGDVMTGSTYVGTRQEPGMNVVFCEQNAEVTQHFVNARSWHTGGRGSLQSMPRELRKEDPHLQAMYGPRHPSCSMQSPELSVAMWYPSNKVNDQLTEISVVVKRMIQVQLILVEIDNISGPQLPSNGIFYRPIVCCDRGPKLFKLLKKSWWQGSVTPPEPMRRRPLPGKAQKHDAGKPDSKRAHPKICCNRRQTPLMSPVLVAVVSKQGTAILSWRFRCHRWLGQQAACKLFPQKQEWEGDPQLLRSLVLASTSHPRRPDGEKDTLISVAFTSRCILRCR